MIHLPLLLWNKILYSTWLINPYKPSPSSADANPSLRALAFPSTSLSLLRGKRVRDISQTKHDKRGGESLRLYFQVWFASRLYICSLCQKHSMLWVLGDWIIIDLKHILFNASRSGFWPPKFWVKQWSLNTCTHMKRSLYPQNGPPSSAACGWDQKKDEVKESSIKKRFVIPNILELNFGKSLLFLLLCFQGKIWSFFCRVLYASWRA